jgi:exosortase H (IPTLxxWG-CTERM-specific)
MLMRGDALVPLQDFTAGATAFFVNLFGSEVQVDGSIISSPSGTPLEIIPECLGIISMAIYASAVLAYPCRFKQKMLGISIGIVALFILNLVRTVSLFYIGSHFPDFLETAHVLIWQSVMILAAIALWLLWMEKLARVPAR